MPHSRAEGLNPSGFAGNHTVAPENPQQAYNAEPILRESGIVGSREPQEYAQRTPVPIRRPGPGYEGR